MDLDPCDDGGFYGNFDKLMPSSNYSLDDIEEILRSTDSHLDSSIDLNNLTPHNAQDFDIPAAPTLDDIKFDSPLYSNEVEYSAQRASSISSMDENSFNPDEFINFLKKEDIKMDFLDETELRQRNTPSPTGSCSSSGGSSTSGVQSDVSSVASRSQTYMEVNPLIDPDNSFTDISNENIEISGIEIKEDNFLPQMNVISPVEEQRQPIVLPTTNANNFNVSTMPLIVPVTVMNNGTTNAVSASARTLQSLQPLQQVLSSALIPVKTVPLKAITQVDSNTKSAPPLKIGPKLAPKSSTSNTTFVPKPIYASPANVSKAVPPINSKPKTVFLTMNDYKVLTETNGKNAKSSGAAAPKIILKTATGKIITANKILSSGNGSLGVHHNFVPKVVKTINGPVVIKQQMPKVIHGGSSAIGTTGKSSINAGPTSLSFYKGLIDEKMWKKQQRMIKNRESASLSRKKKKEYVVSLESRISDLEKENCTLKGENSSLRTQLVALAKSCQCKNSNISEFVLNTLDLNTKLYGGDQHVKIAPKPTIKSIKQRMTAANVKKNIAILFAMAFMVSMNVGNFQNYMNKNPIENSIESAAASADEPIATGRRLLWAETENEFRQKMNNTKRETEMDVPPLHFLHPVNRTKTTVASEQNHNITSRKMPLTSSPNKCTSGSNYTENQRLHSNLHKWIDVNDYLNLSLYKKHDNVLDNSIRFGKFASDIYDRKQLQLPLQEPLPSIKMKRKVIMTSPLIQSKQPKLEKTHENKFNERNEMESGKNYLDIFKPKISEEYLRLFKGIKRQDDTFYVLSFNMDHILLPASAYNKSARPKMSLMLPAGDPSINGDITLMQIDCEVVNTTELELKSSMIPEKLRPQKFGNGNFPATPNANDVVNNETRSREEQRKGKGSMPEMPKQKSPPKTYYMMGPRSAAAAAAMKKKPTLVRLDSSESIENITANAGNNSTIFPKVLNNIG